MPRFHFNVIAFDREGVELPDFKAVERRAQEMLGKDVRTDASASLHHRIEVTDEDGEVVVVVPFREMAIMEDADAA